MTSNRRKKGTGSYRQRANGTWEGRYKGISCTAKTESEVKRKLQNLIRQSEGENALVSTSSSMLFSKWLDIWIGNYKQMSVKPSTLASYRMNINTYIKPFLGNYRLSEITAEYIQSLYGRLAQKGLKPWSIIKVRNIINGALEQAVKNRYIPYNPTHATVSPKIERVELKIFSPAEQRRFMESIKGNRLEALYNTALATGLRLGEILSLTWENVNFEKSEITVVSTISRIANKSKGSRLVLSTPKSKSSRRKIPMLENLKSILLEHKNRQDEERKKPDWRGIIKTLYSVQT